MTHETCSVALLGGGLYVATAQTYDDAGRPTSVPVLGSSNRMLVWDYDSHLKTWSAPGGGSAIFTNNYNGAGTRVSSVVAGGNTQVDLRAGVGQTAPLLKSDNSSVSDVNYVPGISEKRGSTWTWNHSGLKNVDAQSSATPAVTATRTNDAFGNIVTSTGSQAGPFGYGGRFGYQEDSVGYKLLGDRWYDPEVGRFLTRDRAHDGGNWYVYCENNPLTAADPNGLATITIRTSNKLLGHAWIIIRWDDGSIWVIEMVKPGNILIYTEGQDLFDALNRDYDVERTLVFDEGEANQDDLFAAIADRPKIYSLLANNCCDVACYLWLVFTGEDLSGLCLVNTPGQVTRNIDNKNWYGQPSLGNPFTTSWFDRLSPSKRKNLRSPLLRF